MFAHQGLWFQEAIYWSPRPSGCRRTIRRNNQRRHHQKLGLLLVILLLLGGGWYGVTWWTNRAEYLVFDRRRNMWVPERNNSPPKSWGYVSEVRVADNAHACVEGDVIAHTMTAITSLAVQTARDNIATQQATVRSESVSRLTAQEARSIRPAAADLGASCCGACRTRKLKRQQELATRNYASRLDS